MDFEIYKFTIINKIQRKVFSISKFLIKIASIVALLFIIHSLIFYGRIFVINDLERLFRLFTRFDLLSFPILNLFLIIFGAFLLKIQRLNNFTKKTIKKEPFAFKNKINEKKVYPNFLYACFSSKKTCQLLN